jgi:hypothetical protein
VSIQRDNRARDMSTQSVKSNAVPRACRCLPVCVWLCVRQAQRVNSANTYDLLSERNASNMHRIPSTKTALLGRRVKSIAIVTLRR